ncbi:type IX secretion system outer membrane channel protein PorV [Fulvivirga sedimenti]|uniref:Type IX secretion system outer membrane channel protein PorV n=1 Tax=Fulvivirga sedimenti TaxID=2879465 RepID=A0A9X1KZK7_9BACT|nr:type IX secretion system outer membrane channel protein PorV [Fulvivirga sedimenti]MCA6078993.1 type IX secretion system outer membrane channel protein PorV [Fulvivirga sedimenti]
MNKHILSVTFTLICLVTLFPNSSKAQGIIGQDSTFRVITTAVPFLMITPDARAGGMGDVGGATSPDANSVHWNPAKLVFVEQQKGFAISYTPWLGKVINDMWIGYLSGYYKITKEQAVAVSMRYFDLGEIFFTGEDQGNPVELGQFNPRELALDVTYSRMLSQNLSLGVSARYIHSNLTGSFTTGGEDSRSVHSVAADVAVYYTKDLNGTNSNLSLGAAITNIGPKISYSNEENKDFIPTNLRLASAFKTNLDPYNTLTFGLDLNKLMVPSPQFDGSDQDKSLIGGMFGSFADAEGGFKEEMQEITLSLGAEYWYNDTFSGRIGYFYESDAKGGRQYLTMGLGFRYQVFGIDFAYLVPKDQEHPLAETLRFTLLFNFDEKAEESVTD